jgi:hypothetical protein
MNANKWEKNYFSATIYELYVKPIFAGIASLLSITPTIWILRHIGLSGDHAGFSLLVCILSVLLFLVYHLHSKIDLLERTLDPNARCRSSKWLWIEKE